MGYDLIALGETMMSLSPPEGESLIRLSRLIVDHAGAESNTCVGLARLELKVAWVSRLGADPVGDWILDALQKEGVDTHWVRRDSGRLTGLMIKDPSTKRVFYYRNGSAASCLAPQDLEALRQCQTKAVLVTGITALIGAQPQAAACTFLDTARGLRVVDPNFRPGLWGSERRVELVLPLVKRCDLLLGGADELAELVGEGEPHELGRRCSLLGPREVVVRSARKVGVFESGIRWVEIEFQPQETLDPVGAGDAFNAGYIASRLRGLTLEDAVLFAMRCGTAVATSSGDTAGFPRSFSVM